MFRLSSFEYERKINQRKRTVRCINILQPEPLTRALLMPYVQNNYCLISIENYGRRVHTLFPIHFLFFSAYAHCLYKLQ